VGYTVLRLGELDWSTPSAGDRRRRIVRLSDALTQMRANIWRMPAGSRGRRHRELVQDEIFVVLSGTAKLALGEPAEWVELAVGDAVLLERGTAVQLGGGDTEESVILAVGAPAEEGRAEYLPEA
jgi:quercetin dioxygenase-like cupin family protein